MESLGGKVAVITGGASGIGRAFADRFGADGMKLVLADIEKDALDGSVEELRQAGVEAIGVVTDVTDSAAVEALAEETLSAFGAVHLVCNNAGVAPLGPILDMTIESWRWLVDVNIMGVIHGISTFGPILVDQGEGHIVNTASAAGLIATPGLGAYSATKHAIVGLSESLWHELHGTGVGVTVVCPMIVRTNIFNSERNRPEHLGGALEWGERQDRYKMIVDAVGTAPEHIADVVSRAVTEDVLFVLPHSSVKPMLPERAERIIRGENPEPIPSLAL